ncbi:vomeronasal type-2 receptor 116-like [Podarcis raffonei]|uniref:vomeronasal type-2 receptor 116-like n=1 Tax=Podarcis raffonei TaxID=65483 RepID=UPI002329308F|nr:vomeronasal type-2 receptor 116-like [Podarcis raffonei]
MYGTFHPEESNPGQVPSFYRMVPTEAPQYMGIVWLLQHFGWTWVGLFVVDGATGENFLQTLEHYFSLHNVCSAFTQRLPEQANLKGLNAFPSISSHIYVHYIKTTANVFILYGENLTFTWLMTVFFFLGDPHKGKTTLLGKVWIMTTQIDFMLSGLQRTMNLQQFDGAISFTIHSKDPPGFKEFLQNIKPYKNKGDGFLKDFWEQAFDCSLPNPGIPTENSCMGEESLESLPDALFEMHMTGHSYSIYNAVYSVAHTLHVIDTSRSNHKAILASKKFELQHLKPWQVMSQSSFVFIIIISLNVLLQNVITY